MMGELVGRTRVWLIGVLAAAAAVAVVSAGFWISRNSRMAAEFAASHDAEHEGDRRSAA